MGARFDERATAAGGQMMTRKELAMIGEVQDLIGMARSYHGNDRDPNGFAKGQDALARAFQLVVQIRSKYRPEPLRKRKP